MARITYLGSFDDKVLEYHKTQELSIRTLNEILISEIIFSKKNKLLLNDGYIVQSPIIQQAILNVSMANSADEREYYKNSPLFTLISNGNVQVLSRQNTLVEMIQTMADQGIRSYEKIVKIPDWKDKFADIDDDLKDKFVKWPRYNVSQGFVNLVNQLPLDPRELKLSIDKNTFKRIRGDFNNEMSKNLAGPRNKWEEITEGYPLYTTELMGIANRIYHYNFGLCLQADNFSNEDVFVNSITSDLFSDKNKGEINFDFDPQPLAFQIPNQINFNPSFINALARGGELYDIHQRFMAANEDYLRGAIHKNELKDAQNEFVARVIEFDFNHNRNNGEAFNIGIRIALNIGAFATGNVLVGLIAAIFGEFVPMGVGMVTKKIKYAGPALEVSHRHYASNIESLEIEKSKAQEHVAQLQSFR